ncbi:PAS domain-containing hybrid sensor histidine kinase/response regulator [uncultured Anaerofustis sp.]|uniref:hybrid sensor histidine kinase/response regulator n=1 Tax=uncultured Anaerofustis sp. TaxID=904996 RepID=UPI0025D7221F|nr:PAS domain-containing hybrid sensor histidine kinase/response regulator [uncultured Anaerofustis sp.]
MGNQHDLGSKVKNPINFEDNNVLLNIINAGILNFKLDENLTFICANDIFYKDIHYIKEEFTSRFGDLYKYYRDYPKDFNLLRGDLLSAYDKGETSAEVTIRLPLKGEGFKWARISLSITKEANEEVPVVYGVCSDVTDIVDKYKNTSKVLKEKAESFEFMMDEYEGNIYISDMDDYELLYVNKTACETLNQPSEKVLGRKCYEVIQGRTSPCPFCTNNVINDKEFYEWEFDNPVLKRTFMIKNRVINWEGRRARLELSHDMFSTEYKLAKKDQEMNTIVKTLPGGFIRFDARDYETVLWYGADFLSLIGYSEEEFETKLHSKCNYVYPEDYKKIIPLLDELKATNGSAVTEIRIVTGDGSVKNLTMSLCYVPAEDSWDDIPSFYSLGMDVTEERREQERQRMALEDAYKTAKVANEAKTNFLSSMSHDIRTPMNAIMGMAAIAQINAEEPEKVRDCLSKINISSKHLLSLINEVLDMSKIESGKINLMLENIDLAELVGDVADICKPLVKEKNLHLKMSVGRVKHEKVIADGDRLQQVLMNLMSNAIKYTPEGGTITLRINELSSASDNIGQYEFIFIDDGIGMSEEFIPHIFEPFSRAEDTRINKIQGTGLGMAITDNIVRMMNGTIEVQSSPGIGSKFVVSLPMEIQNEEEMCDEELVGLPVLIVDDDQIVCENASALLDELGMRGYWVLSGQEAILSVIDAHERRDDFFAVILDWKMPGMDGLETLKALRENLGDDVPIIIISAYDYSEIEEEFIKAGADAFLSKPLFKSKMLHVLQLFCTHSKLINAFTEEENQVDLSNKRVLLAEDNDLNREIAIELLEMEGIEVDSVENGKRAVEMFEASAVGDYGAILMDIQMPVMNGYDATKGIRALNRADAKTIPIIALTANAFATDVGKARSVGMNEHIAKPINVKTLVKVLQTWMC